MSTKRRRKDASRTMKDEDIQTESVNNGIPKDMRLCLEYLENNPRLPQDVKERLNDFILESKKLLTDHFKDKESNLHDHITSFLHLQINFFFAMLHNILQILYKDELMSVVQKQDGGSEKKIYIIMYQLFELTNVNIKVQRINKDALQNLIKMGYNSERLPKVDRQDERLLVYFSCKAIIPPELSCYFKLKHIEAVAVNKYFRMDAFERLFPEKHSTLLTTDGEVDFPECVEFFKMNLERMQTSFNKIVLNILYTRRDEEYFWGAAGVLNPNFWKGIMGNDEPLHPLAANNTSILDLFLHPNFCHTDNPNCERGSDKMEPFSISNTYFRDHGDVTSKDVMADIKNVLFVENVLPETDTYLFIDSKEWMHFKPSSDIGSSKTFRFILDTLSNTRTRKQPKGKGEFDLIFSDSIKPMKVMKCIKLNIIQGMHTQEEKTTYIHNNRSFVIPSGENSFVPTIQARYVPPKDPEIHIFSTKLMLLRRQFFQNGVDVDVEPGKITAALENSNSGEPVDEESCPICLYSVKKCLSTKWMCLNCKDKHMHQLCAVKVRNKNSVNVPCPFCRVNIPSLKTEHYSIQMN